VELPAIKDITVDRDSYLASMHCSKCDKDSEKLPKIYLTTKNEAKAAANLQYHRKY